MNPYEAPKSQLEPNPTWRLMFWAEGDLLVCRSGTVLPHYCVKTNELVDPKLERSGRKKGALQFVPPWVYFMILLGPVGILIGLMAFHRVCRLEFSLNPTYQRQILRWKSVSLGLTFIGVMGFVAGAVWLSPEFMTFIFLGAITLIFGAALISRFAAPIRIIRHRDGVFYIKGVCPEFLQTMREPERAVSML